MNFKIKVARYKKGKKMNYTEKNKLIDNLCGTGLMLIFVEIFLAIVDSGYNNFGFVTQMPMILKIVGAAFLIIGVILLIIAYRKENGNKAMYGIEFLMIAFISVILSFSYVSFPKPFSEIHKVLPIFFVAYYLVKAIVLTIKAKKKR